MNGALYCSNCGARNDAQAAFCPTCGARQAGAGGATVATPPNSAVPVPYVAAPPQAYVAYGPPAPPNAAAVFRGYGGFWIRFGAVIIDGILMSVIFAPLWLIFFGVGMFGALGAGAHNSDSAVALAPFFTLLPLFVLAAICLNWIYDAALTSSSKQGTVGKMIVGLKVTDTNGNRLSFLHATGRHFAKILSGLAFNIGYIIAGFTERKQALHDFIAGTYVIRT